MHAKDIVDETLDDGGLSRSNITNYQNCKESRHVRDDAIYKEINRFAVPASTFEMKKLLLSPLLFSLEKRSRKAARNERHMVLQAYRPLADQVFSEQAG